MLAQTSTLSVVSARTNVDEQPGAKVTTECLSSFMSSDAATKAEIMWSLQVIAKHQSYRSCCKLREVFQEMFPDSDIAKKFTLSPIKALYVLVCGLAPYF